MNNRRITQCAKEIVEHVDWKAPEQIVGCVAESLWEFAQDLHLDVEALKPHMQQITREVHADPSALGDVAAVEQRIRAALRAAGEVEAGVVYDTTEQIPTPSAWGSMNTINGQLGRQVYATHAEAALAVAEMGEGAPFIVVPLSAADECEQGLRHQIGELEEVLEETKQEERASFVRAEVAGAHVRLLRNLLRQLAWIEATEMVIEAPDRAAVRAALEATEEYDDGE